MRPRIAHWIPSVFLLALAGGARVEAQTPTYDYTVQFSTTTNPAPIGGWSYRDHTNALMTFNASAGRWVGPLQFQTIGNNIMHPGATGGARARWTAPQSGNFLLHVAAHDTNTSCGDGVYINLRHQTTLLVTMILPNGQTTPQTVDRVLAVTTGQTVEVEVTAGAGTNAGCDATGMVIQLSATTAPPSGLVHVEVRVGVDQGPVHTRAVGFLSGLGATTPPDSELGPLKPKMFRGIHVGTFEGIVRAPIYNRIIELGAISQHFMMSQWRLFSKSAGRPAGELPGDGGHWTTWENYVATTIQGELSAGRTHEYDLWNEPNLDFYWPAPRTDTQMFELLCRGYKRAKLVNANVQIVSPSSGGSDAADRTYLQNYLTYAKTNNCVPDVLSWHEINAIEDPWQVVSHVQSIKDFMTAQGIPHPRISINEFGKTRSEERPGVIAVYLAELGRANVASASHACWVTSDSPTQESCGQETLDGLLNLSGGRRGVWWVHAAYAALTSRFIEVAPTTQTLYGAAGWDATARRVVALLGNPRNTTPGTLRVQFTGLTGTSATATLERIPQGPNAITGWTVVPTNPSYPVTAGVLEIPIPAVGPFEVFRVSVQLQTGAVPSAPTGLTVR